MSLHWHQADILVLQRKSGFNHGLRLLLWLDIMLWIYVINLALCPILVLRAVVVPHHYPGLTLYSGSMSLIWLCMPKLDDWPQNVIQDLG